MNRVKIFASIFFFSCTLLGYVQGQNTNNLCLNANPFCTDENPYGVTFPAGTEEKLDIDCILIHSLPVSKTYLWIFFFRIYHRSYQILLKKL